MIEPAAQPLLAPAFKRGLSKMLQRTILDWGSSVLLCLLPPSPPCGGDTPLINAGGKIFPISKQLDKLIFTHHTMEESP